MSHNKIGDVLRAQGKLDEALVSYRAGARHRGAAEPAADPSNAGWQRDLSVSHNKIGDVLRDQGKLDEALASYRAGTAISERLAQPIPATPAGSATSRCRMNKIGDVLGAQGKLDDALASYRASLAIRERLAADRSEQRGLAARPVGVARKDRRRAARSRASSIEALASYRAGLPSPSGSRPPIRGTRVGRVIWRAATAGLDWSTDAWAGLPTR